MLDCGFTRKNKWFRYRAGAIIIENDCVLFAGNANEDYFYSIGGGVHIGETAEDAVKREVYEETGVHYEIDRLAVIHENFFNENTGTLKGLDCHEISFYFLMKPRGTQELCSNSYTYGAKEEMHWVPIADLDKYKAFPTFLKEYLSRKHEGIEHIITDERKENSMTNNALLETDRLILRRFTSQDLTDLHEYLSDPEVVKYEPHNPMSMNDARTNLKWKISSNEMIAVELKSNHKMIGNIYLGKRDFETLEIGFVFNKNYWGQGYAKESCTKLIELAFARGAHRVYAECDPQNTVSWKLLEALGFEREAHLKENIYFWKDAENNPIWKDTYIYSKLNK